MNALLTLEKEIKDIQTERKKSYKHVPETGWDKGYDAAMRFVMMLITEIEAEQEEKPKHWLDGFAGIKTGG